MATWRNLLQRALKFNEETFEDIVANTMTEVDMDQEFNAGWGTPEGCPFTIWTEKNVYFPACYDGSEWVASVSRNPDGHPTDHIGGG